MKWTGLRKTQMATAYIEVYQLAGMSKPCTGSSRRKISTQKVLWDKGGGDPHRRSRLYCKSAGDFALLRVSLHRTGQSRRVGIGPPHTVERIKMEEILPKCATIFLEKHKEEKARTKFCKLYPREEEATLRALPLKTRMDGINEAFYWRKKMKSKSEDCVIFCRKSNHSSYRTAIIETRTLQVQAKETIRLRNGRAFDYAPIE
ncbi:hypothetical protein TNCV_464541 [Trichonephila clavipes]|nr:hypothetical protein TNCV_464541 [Trichonephila clavipes]